MKKILFDNIGSEICIQIFKNGDELIKENTIPISYPLKYGEKYDRAERLYDREVPNQETCLTFKCILDKPIPFDLFPSVHGEDFAFGEFTFHISGQGQLSVKSYDDCIHGMAVGSTYFKQEKRLEIYLITSKHRIKFIVRRIDYNALFPRDESNKLELGIIKEKVKDCIYYVRDIQKRRDEIYPIRVSDVLVPVIKKLEELHDSIHI